MSNHNMSGLKCAEAANICDRSEYEESSLREKLKLRLHLFFCKNCKKYQERNRRLTQLLKKSGLQSCSATEKDNFRKKMEGQNLETSKHEQN